MTRYLASLILVGLLALPALAQQASREADEQAVRKAAQDYLAAMARGDALALAELWTADGDFVDEFGRTYPAKQLIEAAAQSAGKAPARDVKLTATTVRFVSPDVAIEDGTSEVTLHGTSTAEPLNGRFTAVWVRQQGAWRLASLRENRAAKSAAPAKPAGNERLADLDWLIGNWVAETAGGTIEVSAEWNATRTYLLRDMKLTRDGKVAFRGTQRIGWDPVDKRIKSWNFDTLGGYGEGAWSRDGEKWVVQATGVLPDGERSSSTNLVSRDGPDKIVWKTTAARTMGQATPDSELRFVRKR